MIDHEMSFVNDWRRALSMAGNTSRLVGGPDRGRVESRKREGQGTDCIRRESTDVLSQGMEEVQKLVFSGRVSSRGRVHKKGRQKEV